MKLRFRSLARVSFAMSSRVPSETAQRRPYLPAIFYTLAVAGLVAFPGPSLRAEEKSQDLPPPPGALTHELSSGVPLLTNEQKSSRPPLSQPIEIPFIFEGGHIIIEASIDGGSPRPFLFDTGGRNLIARETAASQHAPVARTARIGGIGSNLPGVEMIKVERITIGAATLAQQEVGIIDMPNVILDRGSRPRVAGMIGSELLLRYAVTIDYTRRTLILNGLGFKPSRAAFALPLGFIVSKDGLSHPQVTAEVDGAAGQFIVDTGAGGQLALFEKFQDTQQSFKNAGATLHYLSAGGIGGRAAVSLAYLHQLRFGSYVRPQPLVSGVDHGSSHMGALFYAAGVIGNATLSDFVVTLDMGSAKAYFEPVPDRPHSATVFGTGVVFDKPDHDGFEVLDIIKGSPAERSMLQRGDRVIGIGGRPARDLALADVHMFAPKALPAQTVETADHRRVELSYGRLLP